MKQRHQSICHTIVLLILSTTILTGCGLIDIFNPPFRDKLNMNYVQPITKLDWSVGDSAIFGTVTVLNGEGKKEILTSNNKPILFVAYWCPHCQRTLLQLAKHLKPREMPIIVSLGFVPGTSLSFAKKVTGEEFSQLKIDQKSVTIDYVLDRNANKYTQYGYPTLVFSHHGQLLKLVGEHSWTVWSNVFLNLSESS